jgi:hypothetical protein
VLYEGKTSYKDATKITNTTLAAVLQSLADWLARRIRGTEREVLLVTATFPKAAGRKQSFEWCQEAVEGLLEEGPEEGLDLLLVGQEIHRVRVAGAAAEPVEKAERAARKRRRPGAGEVALAELLKQDEEGEQSVELRGFGHLHAVVVAQVGFRDRIFGLMGGERRPMDLAVMAVGGHRPRKDGPVERYGLQLRRCLRYVVKEYRVERQEGMERWLPELLERPAAKFLLAYDGKSIGRAEELTTWLRVLQKAVPGLVVEQFGGNRPLLLERSTVGSLGRVLEEYLVSQDLKIVRSLQPQGARWSYFLVEQMVEGPGGALKMVDSGAEALYRRMVRYFTAQDKEVADLLTSHERTFMTLADAGGLELPPDLLVEVVEGVLTTADGLSLWWNPALKKAGRPLPLVADRREMVKLLPQPVGYHVGLDLDAGWYRMQYRLEQRETAAQLRRFLYHPKRSWEDNEERLVEFLRAVGRLVRRRERRDLGGIFLWGRPGSGKTPFVRRLVETAWPESWASVKLGQRFGLKEAADKQVVILDDMAPKRGNSTQLDQLKQLMAPEMVLVDRKHRDMAAVDFSRKAIFMTSNFTPERLFGPELRPAMDKRFPVQLEVVNGPCARGNRLGYTPARLRSEMAELVLVGVLLALWEDVEGPDWQKQLLGRLEELEGSWTLAELREFLTEEKLQRVLKQQCSVVQMEGGQKMAVPSFRKRGEAEEEEEDEGEENLCRYERNWEWEAAAYGRSFGEEAERGEEGGGEEEGEEGEELGEKGSKGPKRGDFPNPWQRKRGEKERAAAEEGPSVLGRHWAEGARKGAKTPKGGSPAPPKMV